jgi:GT2 family glycosyltransferase
MDTATTEWVLLLDWDLFACNPFWYDMCISAIKQLEGVKVGCITCVTNRIGNPAQKDVMAPKSDDLMEHIEYARGRYEIFGDKVIRFKGALSGFFMLTNKTAWRAAGGFDETRKRLNGVDNYYSRDLGRAGYPLYGMPGLYYYHIYKKKTLIKWGAKPL